MREVFTSVRFYYFSLTLFLRFLVLLFGISNNNDNNSVEFESFYYYVYYIQI